MSRRRLAVPALSVLVLAIAAAPAQAGPLVASAPSCEEQILEQPFTPWLDPAWYVLSPGGTFEPGEPQWSVAGGAVGAGNEPFYVHGAGEKRSLALGTGGTATSPVMCVGIEHPTLRFFAKKTGGGLGASLRVEVHFEDATGGTHAATIGAVTAHGTWAPSVQMPIVVNLLPLLPGDHTPVAFRFVSEGGGSWLIDDVYVDPYRRT